MPYIERGMRAAHVPLEAAAGNQRSGSRESPPPRPWAALIKQEQDGYANLVLRHALDGFTGTARDRAFLSAVFYGTVERMVTLDHILQKFLQKPLVKLDAAVRAILRSGLYQARYLKSVPVRAAISESVTLPRRGRWGNPALRGLSMRCCAAPPLTTSPSNITPTRPSAFAWSTAFRRRSTGPLQTRCPDQCEDILKASFTPPPLCVRVNTLQTDIGALEEEFARQGMATRRGAVPDSLYVECRGDVTALKLFKQGLFHVQGEAAPSFCLRGVVAKAR